MEKVYVLMSCYNGISYINEQIHSLRNQNSIDTKVFIRNDGSSDENFNLFLKELEKSPDIHVFWGENMGYKRSFMELIKLIPKDAHYYAFCDQDDVWLRDKLKNAVDCLKLYKGPAVYSAQPIYVDANLNETNLYHSFMDDIEYGEMNTHQALVYDLFGLGCTMVWNNEMCSVLNGGQYSDVACGHDNLLSILTPFVGHYYRDSYKAIYYRQHGNNNGAKIGPGSKKIKDYYKKIKKESDAYLLRCQLWEQFGHAMNQKQLFYDSIKYRVSFTSKVRLLLMHDPKIPIMDMIKFKVKVLFNKY